MAQTKTSRKKRTTPSKLKSFNPRTGEVVGEVHANSPAEVRDLVETARKVQPEWAAIAPEGRARLLAKVRHSIYEHLDDIVDTISTETGKSRTEAMFSDVSPAVLHLLHLERITPKFFRSRKVGRLASPLLFGVRSQVEFQPFGVVGAISPWNYPFSLAFSAISAALFAGNCVVIKPSEVTPGVGERIREVLDVLPAGVATVVQGGGDVGAALVDAPVDKICFIGSPATGKLVAESAGKHLTPVCMELGGMDPSIVLEDADLDRAASAVLWGGFFNAGQTCAAAERVYVVDDVADEFTDKLLTKLAGLRVRGLDAEVGPLTMKKQLDTVKRHVDDAVSKGAKVLSGGPDEAPNNDDGSLWYVPTVLTDVNNDMVLSQEESFGPILPIVRVQDEDEALRRANEDGFNLTASIFTSDNERALRLGRGLRAGSVGMNQAGAMTFGIPWAPWGGVGTSGFGRVHGEFGLREFTYPVVLAQAITGLGKSPLWFPYDDSSSRLFRSMTELFSAPKLSNKVSALREVVASAGKAMKTKL
jgi:acyl-CoA reductase-like NAD-dependent aldehyde dehydrogenase